MASTAKHPSGSRGRKNFVKRQAQECLERALEDALGLNVTHADEDLVYYLAEHIPAERLNQLENLIDRIARAG